MPYRVRLLLIAAACALVAAPATAGADVRAQLRVEGPGVTLDPGTTYRTGTERVRLASRSACKPKPKRGTVAGPNALGIVQSAIDADRASSARLRPLRVQTFPSTPGFFACRIGDFASAPGYWLYRVDHVSPTIAADQYRLHRGDDVLWYYANFDTGVNTGDELRLVAARAQEQGVPFTVRVVGFDADGNRAPVQGAAVHGGDSVVTTNAQGKAQVTVSSAGRATLRATHGPDIPSNRVRVSVS